jgi:hypothetical protein
MDGYSHLEVRMSRHAAALRSIAFFHPFTPPFQYLLEAG